MAALALTTYPWPWSTVGFSALQVRCERYSVFAAFAFVAFQDSIATVAEPRTGTALIRLVTNLAGHRRLRHLRRPGPAEANDAPRSAGRWTPPPE